METIKDAVMVLMVLKGFVWVLMEIVVVSTVMSLILLVFIYWSNAYNLLQTIIWECFLLKKILGCNGNGNR